MVSGRNFSDVGEFSSRNSTPVRFVTSMKLAGADAKDQASAHIAHRASTSLARLAFTFRSRSIPQWCTAFLHREYPVRLNPMEAVYHPRRPRDRERVDDLRGPESEVQAKIVL